MKGLEHAEAGHFHDLPKSLSILILWCILQVFIVHLRQGVDSGVKKKEYEPLLNRDPTIQATFGHHQKNVKKIGNRLAFKLLITCARLSVIAICIIVKIELRVDRF